MWSKHKLKHIQYRRFIQQFVRRLWARQRWQILFHQEKTSHRRLDLSDFEDDDIGEESQLYLYDRRGV